jgi:glycerol-3-phosphate acyltransferase PlsY
MTLTALVLILIAYLMGSICVAIPVCKIMGLPDPRSQGSKNPGATNVLRIGGKKAALFTLAGDSIKGVIPVLVAQAMGIEGFALSVVALAAFLGHLYPIFFKFEGGKGVATGFGVVFALAWPLGLILVAIWALMAIAFRYSSLAALTAFALSPLVCFWLSWNGEPIWRDYTIAMAILSVLLIYRHRGNIDKLRAGTESKIGQKKTADSESND